MRALIFLMVSLLSFSSYGGIVKENTYGTLSSDSNSEILKFNSAAGSIEIKIDTEGQKLTYPDGSYIFIKPKQSSVTRFSAMTGRSETALLKDLYSSVWQVTNQVKNIGVYFENFNNTPDMPLTPGVCFDGQIQVPCGLGMNQSSKFDISELLNNVQTNSSSSACSYERARYTNTPYNGHSSLFRCSLGSGVILVSTGIGTIASCIIDPSKLICAAAASAYVGSIVLYEDNKLACNASYVDSRRALEACEEANPDAGGSTGGGSGSGGSGGTGGGSGGSGGSGGFCTSTTVYSVCTSGGCNSWTEMAVVGC
ncbi:hypothetical protein I6E72_05900 [Pseudoalteromonas sp. NSLLW24]|uniref:hypothetical protein n=1 Tax=Pseudoalteromonas sp. NSLLW24 TaxID=2792050 RepID=UPI0018CFABE9|nr:hypothetical protein [Pseudoalteromonas sp. NSLLW24]MBG9998493.1 hypothetical protein [Pseudoalteromonas sp. NSLLW24]